MGGVAFVDSERVPVGSDGWDSPGWLSLWLVPVVAVRASESSRRNGVVPHVYRVDDVGTDRVFVSARDDAHGVFVRTERRRGKISVARTERATYSVDRFGVFDDSVALAAARSRIWVGTISIHDGGISIFMDNDDAFENKHHESEYVFGLYPECGENRFPNPVKNGFYNPYEYPYPLKVGIGGMAAFENFPRQYPRLDYPTLYPKSWRRCVRAELASECRCFQV